LTVPKLVPEIVTTVAVPVIPDAPPVDKPLLPTPVTVGAAVERVVMVV